MKQKNGSATRRGSAASMDISRSRLEREDDAVYSSKLTEALAKSETRSVSILRIAVISALVLTAAVVSVGVFLYTRNEERHNFHSVFEESASQVIDSFHELVENNLGSVASLATDFTSYAILQKETTNVTFPFVTLPNFAQRGSHFRAQSGSHVVHWTPLVTDDTREAWEAYSLENRDVIDEQFEIDATARDQQDQKMGIVRRSLTEEEAQLGGLSVLQDGTGFHPKIWSMDGMFMDAHGKSRSLEDEEESSTTGAAVEPEPPVMSVLEDGTGFHAKIWSNGAMEPKRDEPKGSGPYLPTWQQSPTNPRRQGFLNLNWANTRVMGPGLLQTMMTEKKAVFRNTAVPIPEYKELLEKNLALSQYRGNIDEYVDGLSTFFAYPVFDSFESDKQVAGILSTNIYWKILLSKLLPSSAQGIICVIENSFNQTFSYRIDGTNASFLQMGDSHDPKYDDLVRSESVNDYLQSRASPKNRAYSTVGMSDNTKYTISVYPSQDTEGMFVTNKPIVYTIVVIIGFVLVAVLFFAFSVYVEKRQNIMTAKVIQNADRIAATERELNEYLAHEVRNPLAAAISACSFVTQAFHEGAPLSNPAIVKDIREDIDVINSSLTFIHDFLRSMLDTHRADGNMIKIEEAPVDLLHDILEPVAAILYNRKAGFDVILECPQNLTVMVDSLRLKQVVLNLARNSSKFVVKGFIRLRVSVMEGEIRIFVEDSGPGVPLSKKGELFTKYQVSLDRLNQGTGLGLNLSKKLMLSMKGNVWLDESYNSGIEGYPGACFVVQLNTVPLDVESALPVSDIESDNNFRGKNLADEATLENCAVFDQDHQDPPPIVASHPSHTPIRPDPQSIPNSSSLTLPSQPGTILENAVPALPDDITVLFVDDDAVLRKLFVRAVKKVAPNWKIQQASSGETALQLCDSNSFDVIFMDQYMASANKQLLGTETVAEMRSKGVKSVICGLSANDIRDSFVGAGANEFVLKPIPCKPDSLRKMLTKLLEHGL